MRTIDQQSTARLSGAVEDAVAPKVRAGALAGAVVTVADENRVLGELAFGKSDIAAARPMTRDALFWVASQTKPITATAFMMLVDEGRVSLDDPVAQYLPEFKSMWVIAERDDEHMALTRPQRAITVRDILSHMSGMPFLSDMDAQKIDSLDLRVGVLSYAITPLIAQPGTRYQYSNAGINTVGRIIEVVAGLSYEQFLQDRLFGPLGMHDSTFRPKGALLDRLAKSYRPNAEGTAIEETTIDQMQYPLDGANRHATPGGGLFSTAADMTAFCRMILAGGSFGGRRYVSRAAIAEMATRQTPTSVDESYGLGWAVRGDSFEHGGAYGTGMTIYTDPGFAVVYMVQSAGFIAGAESCRGEVEAVVKSVLA